MPGKMPKDRVPVLIDKFIRMEANGCSHEERLRELFGITDMSDKRAVGNADVKMCRWRKHPLYDQIWKDELRKQDYSDYGEARRVLRKAMRTDNEWLAAQTAVNVLNNAGKRIYGSEENTVTVQIQGLPDIGSPDQEE